MQQENLFAYAHPRFYEPISRLALAPDYVDHLKALLPDEWGVQRWDVWVGATPPGPAGPAHGFKIHVSGTPLHAHRILDLVVPELVRRRVGFKIAGDPRMLSILLSKRAGRGGAGKFMTIYPPTTEAFKELIEALHQATREEDVAGPYILSDRRYADSRVLYYRYGGFRATSVLKPDGSKQSVILGPSGEPLPDERRAYFQLPDWVEDPFGGAQALEYAGTPLLKGRYEVTSVITFSNSGGVYRATDTATGSEVIVKEARPLSHFWGNETEWVDAPALLAREFEVLRRLAPTGLAAEPVDFFTEWEHAFLVEGVVPGRTFQQFWAHDRNILAPFVHRPGRIESFVPTFQRIAALVLDAIERIHERGVMLGDLSPNNILVDFDFDEPGEMRLGFIDFESASLSGDGEKFTRFTREWGTPGYVDVASRSLRGRVGVEDDYYAAGMLLYGAVVPAQNFFTLAPDARGLFLDRFVALGVPAEARDLIAALLAADLEEARRVLAAWTAASPAETAPAESIPAETAPAETALPETAPAAERGELVHA